MSRFGHWFRPATLLGRTALALAIAFLLFGLFAAALLQVTLVRPHTRQAADDLANFLLLAGQIWVELPPYTRPDYERVMHQRHRLKILHGEAPHPTRPASHAYLNHLEAALSEQIGQTVHIHQHPDFPGWLWADFPMAGRIMRLGFEAKRLQQPLLLILPVLVGIGLVAAFVLSLLLVRRVTRPLAHMTEAAQRIGAGDFSATVPESGPREITTLAHKLNQMEQQIGQLLESRTTLLAGISHDLRTPLARMRLELEMIDGEANLALVEGLQADISEMEQLVSQALQLARGLGHEPKTGIDVAALVTNLVQDFRDAGHDVIHTPMPACRHPVQRQALTRVLTNLVDNALTYSEGQQVRLHCERAAGAIEISVRDHGPGIPAGERTKVFRPFHRLEGSRSKTTGGSGLGLAIVDQLCRAYGWEIGIRDPDQGNGSVFALRLPLVGDRQD